MAGRTIPISGRILHIVIGALFLSPIAKGLDVNAFAKMPASDQLDVILAGLKSRDADLQNFEYEVGEVDMIQDGAPPGNLFETKRITMKRYGDQSVLHVETRGKDGSIKDDSSNYWDGSVERGLEKYKNKLQGNIRDHRAEYNHLNYFNHLLGIDRRDGRTVAQWLEAVAHDKQFVLTFSVTEKQEIRVVAKWQLGPKFPSRTEEYRLDPQRGLMLVSHLYLYQSGSKFNRSTAAVRSAKKFGDVWLPTEVHQEASTSAMPGASMADYHLNKIALGSVPASDMELDFPAGTIVVDTRTTEAYRIKPDGSHEGLPILDSATGRVLQPRSSSTSPTTRQ